MVITIYPLIHKLNVVCLDLLNYTTENGTFKQKQKGYLNKV